MQSAIEKITKFMDETTEDEEVGMEHKDGTKDQLTERQGFAKVAKDNDLNAKVVRTVITAYL